jgi:cell division protein FtsQ
MRKPRKKRKNRYQESTFGHLKGNFRAFRSFLAFFAVFGFVILLGSGLSRLYHQLVNAHWLRLERIEITGIKKLDRTEILDAMGVKKGQCTLGINIEQVSESLRNLPEVREADVRLELRGQLKASIVERTPAAIVQCGDQNMLMDLDGVLFSEAAPDEKGLAPFITGLCGAGLKKGDTVAAESLGQMKELLSAIDSSKSWLSGTAIDECMWSENGFTLVLGERSVPVDIGKDAFAQKIAKLRKVINTLNDQGFTDRVTRIDLDYPGRAFLEGQFPIPHQVQGLSKHPG